MNDSLTIMNSFRFISLQDVHSAFSGLDLERPSIGEFFYLGHSSLWMNGASTNENEASIGPFNKAFGCNLFAGQRSRKIMIPSSVDEFFASLHVSNCIVGPPRFTSMLFISFLSLASKTYNSRAHIGLFDSHYASQSCSEVRPIIALFLSTMYLNFQTYREISSFSSTISKLLYVESKIYQLFPP